MTVTVSSMVFESLIMNGEKEIGGTLSVGEQARHLSKMQAMLDSWSLDRSKCYQVLQENFSLTVSTGTYTIGTGGAFNTARPTDILSAFIRDSSSSDSQVTVVGYEAYDSVVVKAVPGSYPRWLYYDKGFDASGLAQIKLTPLPIAGLTLYINSAKQLQTFASITTTLLLPPGYQRAIEYNYCIESAPGMKSVPPEVSKIARDSLVAIANVNRPSNVARMDVGIVKRTIGNIISGP